MRHIYTYLGLGLVLLSLNVQAAAAQKFKMYSTETKKYSLVTTVNYQGVSVSESCLKNTKSPCDAIKAAKTKVELIQTPGVGVIGNPAARYCRSYKALNRILLDQKNAEYDFCIFPDGSVAEAWSLYNKHFSKK